MPRIRLEFSKGDQVRFLSHLDMMKVFARAIRRAEIPIAFSEGFNPHPRMNFASALAVGVTSEKEYLDAELKHPMEMKEIIKRLTRSLPPGVNVKTGRFISGSAPALMAEVNRAAYKVTAEARGLIDADELAAKITDLMNTAEITIMKRTKKGPRLRDIRPGIIHLQGSVAKGNQVDFSIVAVTGNEGNVRPEEVVRAFIDYTGLPIDSDSLYIKRTALYTEKDGKPVNPMTSD